METPEKEIKLSPTLAICLDMFGQTLAHRVTSLSDIRWLGQTKLRDSAHHGGRRVDEWNLQARDIWRTAMRMERTYPRNVKLSPPTRKILTELKLEKLEREAEAADRQRIASLEQLERWISENAAWELKPLKYKPLHPQSYVMDAIGGKNRLSIVQAGTLTVMNLLGSGGWGYRKMSENFCSLVVWLHAVPFYIESDDIAGKQVWETTSIDEWCSRRFARFGPDRLANETAYYEREYRLWVKRGNAAMGAKKH